MITGRRSLSHKGLNRPRATSLANPVPDLSSPLP